jgi:hypothetical protein
VARLLRIGLLAYAALVLGLALAGEAPAEGGERPTVVHDDDDGEDDEEDEDDEDDTSGGIRLERPPIAGREPPRIRREAGRGDLAGRPACRRRLASVIIAARDTGVDALHPDLLGATVAGRDFVNDDFDPSDDEGHGTGVAAGGGAARSSASTRSPAPTAFAPARTSTARRARSSARGRSANLRRPRLLGRARVGQTLRVVRGAWTPSGVRLSYRWPAAPATGLAAGRSGGRTSRPILRQSQHEAQILMANMAAVGQLTREVARTTDISAARDTEHCGRAAP